ncbi:hypothetical protein [Candidatus Coxiella mudrowiae]|uniref:hypothetical protein n=1 Tax=Candidatus Coxiella mudrowiae TaxID=2054173 RepID=UPI003CC8335D
MASEPHSAKVRNNYGMFLFCQGRYKQAMEQFLIASYNPTYRYRVAAYQNMCSCGKIAHIHGL